MGRTGRVREAPGDPRPRVGAGSVGAGWRACLALATVVLPVATGCGDDGSRGGDEASRAGAESPAETVRIPSGASALPPSAGLPVADTTAGDGTRPPDQDDAERAAAADTEAARRLVEEYYHAITSGEYRQAYRMWEEGAIGQSYDAFRAGFRGTDRVGVTAGAPGPVEGAAGSRYVRIPVVVEAVTSRGARQRFEGTYTLRRSVVDGATEAQRRWQIYDAEMQQVTP